jgi:phosphoglycolate phosphatase
LTLQSGNAPESTGQPDRTPFRAVVFDLDGTLVDSAPDLHLVLDELMGEIGMAAPSLESIRTMVGDGARALIVRAFAAAGRAPEADELELLYARFLARYSAEPCRASTVFEGGLACLERLGREGVRLGLCTNKPQAPTLGLLDMLGLQDRFASVIGGDRLPVRKPDPKHLEAVLDELGVPPDAALMVGDSRNDLLTARALGVPCILVSFGYTAVPAAELGADLVIDRLAALPEAMAALTCTTRHP